MNDKNKSLFSEFPPVTTEQWMERVTADLKGADFDKKLVWKNLSGINIQPCYNFENKITQLKNTGENSQSLVNYRSIVVATAESGNKLALKAVEEGMNGIIFQIKENVSAATLLNGIDLNEISVSFELADNAVAFTADVIKVAKGKDLKGYIDTGIISNYVTTGSFDGNQVEVAAELVKMTADYPNFKAITISGTEYLDSGANQVQEIAYTLNSLVFLIEKLTEKGIDAKAIFNNFNFKLAIGLEYFVEIGKFRAFNSLLAEVAAKYGVAEVSKTVMAKTSIWSKSITDANTNMLRATTEAMSAILGNVDGVLIDPYDKEFKEPSDFSSRIAGNITTILREESYFGKVTNPVDGSYYVEEVTSKIAEKALELFKSIEAAGGFYKAFENETIQQQIAEIRLQKLKLISQRRLPMVGVNKYPNLMETVSADLLSKGSADNPKVLTPRRASLEIEAMRRKTEELVAETNVRPIVQLASYGNLTMRKARAAFAYDFIGVSGFDVHQEESFESAAVAAEKSAKSDSHVVVICSSDQDYDETALDFIKAFRAITTSKVLLLAGAPKNLDELTEAGLDGIVNMRTDVLKTLSSIQEKVQKTLKS
ncbi:methylmalonyl-CoA mutase small subunit [Maribacter polysiphoniae]|uniref:Methylmalonyl-CoA mutase small subunit n=1 Tax=Maribacter polysiphoniae TaxID=429344 RepID=A0A316DWW5_9FLAO|nr:methylmalonyl-CoA mutase family protein [Maribacter polysiphoniae]MBD1262733.1 methylmalonyl-CoA mutase small subunit [Maribacter polysiphoniae]PWK21978.1 heterodimeric methylmalonyl-CoA mutase small subunit [Maribacter polysiphoniae]